MPGVQHGPATSFLASLEILANVHDYTMWTVEKRKEHSYAPDRGKSLCSLRFRGFLLFWRLLFAGNVSQWLRQTALRWRAS